MRSSLKIAFVLNQSLESPSGLGRYLPLAEELAKQGHAVHIVALHHDYATLSKRSYQKGNLRVHYVAQMHVRKVGNTKHYYKTLVLLWIVFWSTLRLTLKLFEINPDIVHAGKPQPMNGVSAWLYARLKRRPFYVDCDDYEAASNRFGHTWQRRIVALIEDQLSLKADVVTVNTHFTEERLLALGCKPEKILYVPNGVDRNRFTLPPGAAVTTLRETLAIAEKDVVLYVGSMSLVSHSVDLLIKSFVRVRESLDDVVLLLVGGGEDLQILLNLSEQLELGDSVISVGRVPPENVPLYYGLATLSVDPVIAHDALRGRCPLKVFESLALGVPVITGDIGDRKLILKERTYGFLVAPGDEQALSQAIITALLNKDQLAKMQEKILAEREIAKVYWDLLVDDFAIIYNTQFC